MNRRTTIVCTLGAATDTVESIVELAGAGMTVARLNLSGGSPQRPARAVGLVREAGRRLGVRIPVLADLPGGKIRIGRLAGGRAAWAASDTVVLVAQPEAEFRTHQTWVTVGRLLAAVHPGDRLLVDDGRVRLRVVTREGPCRITCRVEFGGEVTDHRGIAAPGVEVRRDSFGPRDAELLEVALDLGVELVALSFVGAAGDVLEPRRLARRVAEPPRIFAKIEDALGVAAVAEIADAFDGVIVGRGDLGVEVPYERVPVIQKRIAVTCRRQGTPVWVATQLLHSMMTAPYPTRAEVSDIANAVLDGFDGCMLCGETGFGRHPIDAARTLARVIDAVEDDLDRTDRTPARAVATVSQGHR